MKAGALSQAALIGGPTDDVRAVCGIIGAILLCLLLPSFCLDLLFHVQRLLQDKDKPDARVEYLLDYNRLVTEAQGDSGLQTTFEPIDLDLTTMFLIVPGDSS